MIWTVEERDGRPVAVETEDGEVVRTFATRDEAIEWLDWMQAAAEAAREED